MRYIIFYLSLLFVLQPIFIQRKSIIRYSDRNNRIEGIKDSSKVSETDIDFCGAYIGFDEFPPIDFIDTLKLISYLKESAELEIKVKDLIDAYYKMIPYQPAF